MLLGLQDKMAIITPNGNEQRTFYISIAGEVHDYVQTDVTPGQSYESWTVIDYRYRSNEGPSGVVIDIAGRTSQVDDLSIINMPPCSGANCPPVIIAHARFPTATDLPFVTYSRYAYARREV